MAGFGLSRLLLIYKLLANSQSLLDFLSAGVRRKAGRPTFARAIHFWHSNDFDFDQLFAIGIGDMHRAGNAGIEAVDGAQDFDRLLGIM